VQQKRVENQHTLSGESAISTAPSPTGIVKRALDIPKRFLHMVGKAAIFVQQRLVEHQHGISHDAC